MVAMRPMMSSEARRMNSYSVNFRRLDAICLPLGLDLFIDLDDLGTVHRGLGVRNRARPSGTTASFLAGAGVVLGGAALGF